VYRTNAVNGGISISGTAKVTSANTNTNSGTIVTAFRSSQTSSSNWELLTISGGTVENTSTTTGNTVYNSDCPIKFTGGTVSKAGNGNYVVYNGGSKGWSIAIRYPAATIVGNINDQWVWGN